MLRLRVVLVGVILYYYQIDFTLCYGLLYVFVICLLLFGMACMIVFWVSGPNYVRALSYSFSRAWR